MDRSRALRERLKSGLHGLFVLGQRFGLDMLPRHFYSSVPDIRALQKSEFWRPPTSMIGVAGADIESQMSFLQACCPPPLQQHVRQAEIHAQASAENGAVGFGHTEAEVLYCVIARKRPRKIVQIGCGFSTSVILRAARETGYTPHIICIDPFPNAYLSKLAKQNLIELISIPAQEVDLEVMTTLDAGDFLFVDSTHTVQPGSEVNRIVLEVLPRLRSGTLVHFHDIFFPYDYQSSLMTTLFFATESSLLHAFLIDNRKYAIAVSLSMLHHACPERLQQLFPNHKPALMDRGLDTPNQDSFHFPSSTYLSVL